MPRLGYAHNQILFYWMSVAASETMSGCSFLDGGELREAIGSCTCVFDNLDRELYVHSDELRKMIGSFACILILDIKIFMFSVMILCN